MLLLLIMFPSLIITASCYNEDLQPGVMGNTIITWDVIDAPTTAFSWWGSGFIRLGNWIADDGTKMTFEVTKIGESNEYLTGNLVLGNLSITTNNTDISNNLILGLSGLTGWYPGLIIPIGDANIQAQNQTAYAAAERVGGNWLNGTVESWYETLSINEIDYNCIVWNFIQDPPSYGEPQLTYLSYDLETGVLVRCNSTFTFNYPYSLVLELDNIQPPQVRGALLIALGIGSVAIAILVAVILFGKKLE